MGISCEILLSTSSFASSGEMTNTHWLERSTPHCERDILMAASAFDSSDASLFNKSANTASTLFPSSLVDTSREAKIMLSKSISESLSSLFISCVLEFAYASVVSFTFCPFFF